MRLRLVLRCAAIAIAMAALIDPVLTREESAVEPVTVVAVGERAVPQATRVRDALSTFDATTWLHDPTLAAAACPAAGACVIVSSGHVPRRVSAGSRVVAVVEVGDRSTTHLQRIEMPSPVHRDAAASVRVHTSRTATHVDVFDGNILVGSSDAKQQTVVDVPWVPVVSGARALRVVVDGEVAHAGVVVESAPRPVLLYESQASWLGTFVRRALEDDTRFDLRARTRIAPPVTITRGDGGALTGAALAQVGTVVISAPEMLSTSEVDLLEQFVARRGGSLIVLPDQRPTGASLRLLPRVAAERREPQARSVGALRATEWLTFEPAFGVLTLAAIDDQPVIVSRAYGRGRVIVSGALDAWRYRQAGDGFAQFWTSLAWHAAALAGPPLRVETDRVIARPGEELVIAAEAAAWAATSRDDVGARASKSATVAASGTLSCGADRDVLRLWPGARPGSFRGTVRVDRESDCVVTVDIDGVTGSTPVTFRDDLRQLPAEDGQLDALAAAHGAAFVSVDPSGDTRDELLAHVRERLTPRRETVAARPMRSPLWLLPFVLCLGGEWWLRRQNGLS